MENWDRNPNFGTKTGIGILSRQALKLGFLSQHSAAAAVHCAARRDGDSDSEGGSVLLRFSVPVRCVFRGLLVSRVVFSNPVDGICLRARAQILQRYNGTEARRRAFTYRARHFKLGHEYGVHRCEASQATQARASVTRYHLIPQKMSKSSVLRDMHASSFGSCPLRRFPKIFFPNRQLEPLREHECQ